MFGYSEDNGRGRRPHGGRGGHGKRLRGRCRCAAGTAQARLAAPQAADERDERTAGIPGSGTCPLCENRCSLAAPGCGQGRAYARGAGA